MAAAQGHLADGADSTDGQGGAPIAFRHAVAGLRGARPRPEVELEPTAPPRRLAPYAYALEAVVAVDASGQAAQGGPSGVPGVPGGPAGHGEEPDELAEGRLILLHDPAGHDAWRGTFRLVTLVHADLEAEMAADPLLPEVCWSWLTGALQARGVSYGEPSGTVTLASSHHFGGLADREPSTRIEIRASWTPSDEAGPPDTASHLAAWCDLLCQIAGLPPAGAADSGVVSLPQRRGPQPR
ncbi:DUF3000 domain-containing protein [Streptomyces sp. LX-29]|uniref:DUF3000 domain-containing protein n=1 Tax=Streptomyces sp. LX-29 TaxID=2900152 RepID=UPI00240D0BD0|nr:DUF3000 domain-containing protein [Streptomyces sp. LX-29]WFB06931.1 DUF3000 domain-containing protein [Streptomyces sp. LX-29]